MPRARGVRKPADGRRGRCRQKTPPPEQTPQNSEVVMQPEASQEASLDRQSSRSSSAASGASAAKSQSPSRPPSPEQKKKRAKKTEFTLNAEQENAMCEFLQENAMLWDTKLTNYRRTDMKSKLWEDQATKLEKTVEHLKGWFKSLRDAHTRLDKKKSGAGVPELTERDQWIKKSFEFLKGVVRHRSEPVRPIRVELPVDDDLVDSEMAVQSMEDQSASTSSSSRQTGKKRGKADDDDVLLVSLQEQVEKSGEILRGLSQPKKMTATTAFANYVRDSLISMSKDKFKKARSQINKVLTDLLEEDSGDEDLSAVVNPASCKSAPAPTTYSLTSSKSELYQLPTHMWQHRAPAASVWQSQSSDYVQNYFQEPLLPAFQQQSLQQPQESTQSTQPLRYQPTVNRQPPAAANWSERQSQASICPGVSSVISTAHQVIDLGQRTTSPAAVATNEDGGQEHMNLSISGLSRISTGGMSDIFPMDSPLLGEKASTPAATNKQLDTPPGPGEKK